jgi:hypothetical protein
MRSQEPPGHASGGEPAPELALAVARLMPPAAPAAGGTGRGAPGDSARIALAPTTRLAVLLLQCRRGQRPDGAGRREPRCS